MERYSVDTDPFTEDPVPAWLQRQIEEAEALAEAAARRKPLQYAAGDAVGGFIFVRYTRFKNRATFECPECGRKFVYNIYGIKNKKRCKWYRFHDQSIKKR
jgi:hypothetical protein